MSYPALAQRLASRHIPEQGPYAVVPHVRTCAGVAGHGYLYCGNFRQFSASITRMATLADSGRIDMALVEKELERLRTDSADTDRLGLRAQKHHSLTEYHALLQFLHLRNRSLTQINIATLTPALSSLSTNLR